MTGKDEVAEESRAHEKTIPKENDARDTQDTWREDLEAWTAAGKPWIAPSDCSWLQDSGEFFD